MYKRIILILLIMIAGKFLVGQVSNDRFAISFKLGDYASPFRDIVGGSVRGAEVNTTFNKIAFSLDYYRFEESAFILSDYPSESYNQIGFMIGKNHDSKNTLFSMQLLGGIAPFWGTERTNFLKRSERFLGGDIYETENFTTIGLALKMGLKIIPFDVLGIGLDLQANINIKRPVFLFMLSIDIGKLK